MKTKTSYGISLTKYNKEENNRIEIILIKKRYSFSFYTFVMGFYKKNDITYLKYLFNTMSFSEKIDIISMQFSNLWYRIFLNIPEKHFNIVDIYKSNTLIESKFSSVNIYKTYFQKKNKFEKNFTKDNGKKLRHMIFESSDSEILWEIPKGTKNENETDIDCSIREFYEETSISPNKYKILYDVDPIIDTFIDNDTIYKTIYYIAEIRNKNYPLNPKINFKSFEQISEIEQIKWVSLSEIKFLKLHTTVHKRLVKLYTEIIHKFKKYNSIASYKNIPLISGA